MSTVATCSPSMMGELYSGYHHGYGYDYYMSSYHGPNTPLGSPYSATGKVVQTSSYYHYM